MALDLTFSDCSKMSSFNKIILATNRSEVNFKVIKKIFIVDFYFLSNMK